MDSSEEMMLFVEDMQSVGIEPLLKPTEHCRAADARG